MKDFFSYGLGLLIVTIDKLLAYATISFGASIGVILAYKLFIK